VTFTLPGEAYGRMWQVVVDTADPLLARAARARNARPSPAGGCGILSRSLLVMQRRY
jgi:glycogen operon protein